MLFKEFVHQNEKNYTIIGYYHNWRFLEIYLQLKFRTICERFKTKNHNLINVLIIKVIQIAINIL